MKHQQINLLTDSVTKRTIFIPKSRLMKKYETTASILTIRHDYSFESLRVIVSWGGAGQISVPIWTDHGRGSYVKKCEFKRGY